MRLREASLEWLLPVASNQHPNPKPRGYIHGVVGQARKSFHGKLKRGFDSLGILTAWHLRKQRNARVFNRNDQVRSETNLVHLIHDEIKLWKKAGLGVEGLDPFVRE